MLRTTRRHAAPIGYATAGVVLALMGTAIPNSASLEHHTTKVKVLRPHGQWVPLTDGVADAVAEGVDDPMSIPDSHDGCLMRVTKAYDVTIICPDGRVIRS